jgi:hypothetical protein
MFVAGLAISTILVYRSQVAWDPLQMLARGWLLAERGVWVPFGVEGSAGGYAPGGIVSILTGLPLLAWMDYRSPALLVLLCHVVAYLLLDRIVGESYGLRGRILFSVFYWLSPWRLFFSGFVWNPNYLFLVGAIHAWACFRQRERGTWLHSALLVSTTGLALQLHPSALILVLAAVIFWLRGGWRPHWGGVALGAIVSVVSLVPWAVYAAAHPQILPGEEGYPLRNLVRVAPVLKGVLYWIRYSSLWVSSKWMARFDFTPTFGASADAVLSPAFYALTWIVGPLTVAVPLLANVSLLRRRRRRPTVETRERSRMRHDWLERYVIYTFGAMVLTFAISPTTVMMWQGLIAFHAAILPLLFGVRRLLDTERRAAVKRGLAIWVAASLVVTAGMTFGSQMYRVGGRDSLRSGELSLRKSHPLLTDLGLDRCCGIAIDPVGGRIDVEQYLRDIQPHRFGGSEPEKSERGPRQ